MIQYLDESSPECKTIGAANTISNENGKFIGYNTDMDGFLEPIKSKNIGISGESVLVLGSGGAARAIVAGFAKEKARKITIANRTIQRAQDLSRFVSSLGAESDHVTLNNVDVTKYKFIINATSIGLKNEPSPISTSAINSNHIVYDIIYMPMNTDLIQQSKKNSATIIYGYEMLLGQAVLAFQIWHKIPAPYEAMKKVLLGGF